MALGWYVSIRSKYMWKQTTKCYLARLYPWTSSFYVTMCGTSQPRRKTVTSVQIPRKSKQLVQNKCRGKQCSTLCKEAQHGAVQLYNVLPLHHVFMPLILVLLAFKRQYLVFYINMPLKYKNVVSRQGFYTEIPRVTLSKVISHGNALAC